jgi:hypothetical protein
MEKIKWSEKVTNEQVLDRTGRRGHFQIISYVEKPIGLVKF